MKILSERLFSLRLDHDLTQKAVAQAVGIALRTYQNYESGKREPNVSIFVAIAKFYNVSLNYLAGLSDVK